jgi:hypothetical protein
LADAAQEVVMAVTVALICFVLLFAIGLTYMVKQPLTTSWRVSFLSASLVWGVYLATVTEILSLLHLLTVAYIFACWMAFAIALQAWMLTLLRKRRRLWTQLGIERLPLSLQVLLGALMMLASVSLVVALLAPPNTPDTLTYHLARVVHWIQNGSLQPYPTNSLSQLFQPPWDEYVLLHLHLLTGGDMLDGAVQWFSFVGCTVGVSLIAKQLGAGQRGQVYAAVFAGTIPMAIVQASSTQNDLTLAYWLVCVVYFLLVGVGRPSTPAIVGAGLSLGLAALTKGTAYIDLLPFVLIFTVAMIRRQRWGAWKPLAAIALLALALNIGYYARNLQWSGAPLGPADTTSAFNNSAFTPDVLLLNVVRNVAVEFGTPDHQANLALNGLVYRVIQATGLDPNDPRATMRNSPAFLLRGDRGFWLSDGYAVNPLHLLLIFCALILCASMARLRRHWRLLAYFAALISSFLLFSFYFRWQAGGARLLLGLFVLAAPGLGVVLDEAAQTDARLLMRAAPQLVFAINLLLLLSSLPWHLASQSRPLIGTQSVLTTPRRDQYFAAYPAAEQAFLDVTHFIEGRSCRQVGFYASGAQDRAGYTTGAPSWEYLLWVLLNRSGSDEGSAERIEQVQVMNRTAALATTSSLASFQPCAIFAIVEQAALQDSLMQNGVVYRQALTETAFPAVSVAAYVPAFTNYLHTGFSGAKLSRVATSRRSLARVEHAHCAAP